MRAALAGLIFFTSIHGYGATLEVSNVSDAGAGSLREALALASDGDTITFHNGTNGLPIVISSAPIDVVSSVTIIGNGTTSTIVDGDNLYRLFTIGATNDLSFENMALTNGFEGAAMDGALLGPWDHSGHVQVERCELSGFNGSEYLLFNGSFGTTTFIDSYFHDNGADSPATLIHANDFLIDGCTFSNNDCGPAHFMFSGLMDVVNSTFVDNSGWAILWLISNFNLTNCTVANNSCDFAAVAIAGGTTLIKEVHNSIIYGNSPIDVDHITTGLPLIQSFNIVGSTNSTGGPTTWYSTSDPLFDLVGLAYNGAAIPTLGVYSGSPAIGVADDLLAPITDQRGMPRYGQADVGAYEVQEGASALEESSIEFSIYPNPAIKNFHLNLGDNGSGSISIYDLAGAVVHEASFQNQSELQIEVDHLSRGIYLLEVRSNGEVGSKRIKLY